MPSRFDQPHDSLANVSGKIREILQDADYGGNVITDNPQRFAAILADKLGSTDRGKLKSIKAVLTTDIYKEILKAVRSGANYRAIGLNSAKILQKAHNLSEADSHEAIDFLLVALGETPLKGEKPDVQPPQHRGAPLPSSPSSVKHTAQNTAQKVKPKKPPKVKQKPPPPVDTFYPYKIEVFEHGGHWTHPQTTHSSFYQNKVRYIGFALYFTRSLNTRVNATCHFEYFDSNGISISQQQSSQYIIHGQTGRIECSGGCNQPKVWEPGKYTIRASIGNSNTIETSFEINNVSPADTFTAKRVEVLEHDGDWSHQPTLGTTFYQDEARKIGFILSFTRTLNAKTNTTCLFEFFDSSWKSVSQQQRSPCIIDGQSGRIAYSWGESKPGHWKPGKYTIRVSIGNSNTVEARFEIKQKSVPSPPSPIRHISRLGTTAYIFGRTKTVAAVTAVALFVFVAILFSINSAPGPIKAAYEEGVRAVAGKDYKSAVLSFNKVTAYDANYKKTQSLWKKAVGAYKVDVFRSCSALESEGRYEDAINELNATRPYISEDEDVSKKLTHYTNLMHEKKKALVLGKIKGVKGRVASSRDYAEGITTLKSLRVEYPAFAKEIEAEIAKFTQASDSVSGRIRDISSHASSPTGYDEGITELNKLLNEYPAFDKEINAEISTLTSKLLRAVEVHLDKTSITLAKGATATLAISTIPVIIRNLDPNKWTWASSDASVAFVDAYGRVTAVGFGMAEIRLRTPDGNVKAACVVSVNAMLGRDVKTYWRIGVRELTKKDTAKMMGAVYDNGLVGPGNIEYNIGGKFTRLSGIFGPLDSAFEGDTSIVILGDGKQLRKFDIRHDDSARAFTVPIKDVLGLSFRMSSHVHGIFNIMLSSGEAVTPQFETPAGVYGNAALLGKDIKAYKLQYASEFTRASPVKMARKEYEYGFANDSAYKADASRPKAAARSSRAYYNLNGKYKKLSGVYGPLDGISSVAAGTIKILGDDRELETFNVKYGDAVKPFSVDVTGVTKIVFEITSNNKTDNAFGSFGGVPGGVTARFGLAEMQLSD